MQVVEQRPIYPEVVVGLRLVLTKATASKPSKQNKLLRIVIQNVQVSAKSCKITVASTSINEFESSPELLPPKTKRFSWSDAANP